MLPRFRPVALFCAALPFALAIAAIPATAQDQDGDGWTIADGDCCDLPGPGCPYPSQVNPGAYDVAKGKECSNVQCAARDRGNHAAHNGLWPEISSSLTSVPLVGAPPEEHKCQPGGTPMSRRRHLA